MNSRQATISRTKAEGLWVGATKARSVGAAIDPLSDARCAKGMARFNSCLGIVLTATGLDGLAPETESIGSRGKCNRWKMGVDPHYIGPPKMMNNEAGLTLILGHVTGDRC